MSDARMRHRLPFGAELSDDGFTCFRLWAPGAAATPSLVFSDGREVPMQPEAEGWYSQRAAAPAGTLYRYRVAPDLVVPDPAARAQSGDVHGWSMVVDPSAYRWQREDWAGRPWHETVLYEAHVGALGRGFAGIEQELGRLAELGVTAIELMPVADFPGRRNWGYDGVLPYAPDESYGSPDAMKRLIDVAHGHGLMVFLDVVYNHFGPDGNYLHAYAPQFFAKGVSTPWGPALDFRRPQVRDFFIQNAIYWLKEFHIDGLRLDAAHAIDAAPGEDFLLELATRARAAVSGRHVHLVLEHDDNAARHIGAGMYDAQWNDDGHHVLHVLLTGEGDGYYADYADAPARHLARCLAEGFVYQGQASAHRGGATRGEPSAHLPPKAFVLFMQNHDQIGNRAFGDRLAGVVPIATVRAATALMMLCPQVPMLFMGEEWSTERPFLYFTDHDGALADAVREGRRREFARFAAFADPGALARIPDPNDPATYERSCLDAGEATAMAHASEVDFRRRLLALRRDRLMPVLAEVVVVGAQAIGPAAVHAAWRLADGSTLEVLCNLGTEGVHTAAPASARPLFAVPDDALGALSAGVLSGRSTIWYLDDGPRDA